MAKPNVEPGQVWWQVAAPHVELRVLYKIREGQWAVQAYDEPHPVWIGHHGLLTRYTLQPPERPNL